MHIVWEYLLQDFNDLCAEDVVGLQVGKNVDEVIIPTLMELPHDVGTDV